MIVVVHARRDPSGGQTTVGYQFYLTSSVGSRRAYTTMIILTLHAHFFVGDEKGEKEEEDEEKDEEDEEDEEEGEEGEEE